jgi:hypothetical protein
MGKSTLLIMPVASGYSPLNNRSRCCRFWDALLWRIGAGEIGSRPITAVRFFPDDMVRRNLVRSVPGNAFADLPHLLLSQWRFTLL